MKLDGYAGSSLRVNLTTGQIKKEATHIELAEKYIGGYGMCQRLAYKFLPAKLEPWASENPIIICPGFLNGTLSPSACKVFMTTKEPASGTVSTWVGSLHLGAKLKWAGYDNVVINGKASTPVYLNIADDEIEICDASHLWGKADIFDTVDALREKHGNQSSVAAIGPAGENMVKISMVFIDKATTWGRAAGSIWGSKNLKAIVVNGTKSIKVNNINRCMSIIDNLVTMAMSDPHRNDWKSKALYYIWSLWEEAGYMTTSNQRETSAKQHMLGPLGTEEYLKHRALIFGCPACITPDKAVLKIKDGKNEGFLAPTSTSIDPALCFGSRLKIYNMDEVIKLWDVANRAGIDSATFTAMLGWAIDLYEKGILTKEDTGGIELREGPEVAKIMLDQTINNKGFGSILGLGFKGAEKMIGKGSEKFAIEVKGTEPDFDARASLGVETFTAQVNVRPCRDLPIGGLTVAKGRKPSFFQKAIKRTGYVPEKRFNEIVTSEGFDLPRLTVHYENWACILDMMGICFRMPSSSLWNVKTVAELYSAVTGKEKSQEQLLRDAERVNNLAKVLNVREGFDRKDDRFPERYFEPLERPDRKTSLILTDYFGKRELTRKDTEQLLSDYYEEHGWDVETGIPTKEKLIDLGLEDAAEDICAVK